MSKRSRIDTYACHYYGLSDVKKYLQRKDVANDKDIIILDLLNELCEANHRMNRMQKEINLALELVHNILEKEEL
jgi:hypothetical protein